MSTKFERVWIGKSHLFKKTFLKLSLQFIMPHKYLDRLYSKCCKILKAYLTSRRANFASTQPRNYYFWFSWVSYFLKISLWRKSLSYKLSLQGLSLCDRDMRQLLCNWIINMIFMNRYLKPVTMLKKRFHLRCFLANFVSFYETSALRLFANYYLNFSMNASRLFTIEPIFCKRNKNHKQF